MNLIRSPMNTEQIVRWWPEAERVLARRAAADFPPAPRAPSAISHAYGKWTEEEDRFIREHWRNCSDATLAKCLERPLYSVINRRCYKLSLKRRDLTPKEWR